MYEQERQEVSELILRALHMKFEVGVMHACPTASVESVMLAAENCHHAERELWEAFYRIRVDYPDQRDQRARGTDTHGGSEPVIRIR